MCSSVVSREPRMCAREAAKLGRLEVTRHEKHAAAAAAWSVQKHVTFMKSVKHQSVVYITLDCVCLVCVGWRLPEPLDETFELD